MAVSISSRLMSLLFVLFMTTLFASALTYILPKHIRRRSSLFSSTTMPHFLQPSTAHPYQPPSWAKGKLTNVPKHGRLHLANLPTPIQLIASRSNDSNNANGPKSPSGSILARLEELNINLFVKRDDATGGAELGGNKVRKLEFLLADALAKGCDSVVTIGGEQSNHCRATAAASRMVGLSPHLILRTQRATAIHEKKDEIGWTGNILFDRMVGSTIYTCTPGEYGRMGSNKLVDGVCDYLQFHSKIQSNPYPIPVGGSNGVGTWGYINAVDELKSQIDSIKFEQSSAEFKLDHVVFASGSGGTAAGITLGMALAFESPPKIHAVGVCDYPEYFYQTMASLADEMGLSVPPSTSDQFIRNSATVHHGKGRGYAYSTDDELDFILQFSLETGIALDPVYSGKALYHFLKKVVEDDPESYRNTNILFWHTGGALGIYEKGDDLLGKLQTISNVKRIDIYGKKGSEGNDDMVSID